MGGRKINRERGRERQRETARERARESKRTRPHGWRTPGTHQSTKAVIRWRCVFTPGRRGRGGLDPGPPRSYGPRDAAAVDVSGAEPGPSRVGTRG